MVAFMEGQKNVIRLDLPLAIKRILTVFLFFNVFLMILLFSTPADLLAVPAPPTGLIFIDDGTLQWDPNSESDLAGYNVYWDTPSGVPYDNMINVGDVTTYTIDGLPEEIIYAAVTAYDTGGNESDFSEEASFDRSGETFKYTFDCYYENGTGDYYWGYFYDTAVYEQNVPVLPFEDEHGNPGFYLITDRSEAESGAVAGQVFVDSYFDSESGETYCPITENPVGTDSLGSEDAYIIAEGQEEYRFGGGSGTFYEADSPLISYAYGFKCTYGNGDYYCGTFYGGTDAPEDYYEGYNKTFTDENGREGYYEITAQAPAVDGLAGQVFVDSYYDEESNYTYTPLHAGSAVGEDYLGSERDYLLLNGYVLNRFGVGPEGSQEVLYEADVTYAQYIYNQCREPFRTIRLNSLHRCYLLQGARHPELFDDDVL